MRDWSECTLGELLEIKHGFAFKGEYFSDAGDFVLLTPGNFREDGGLKLKGEKEKYYVGPFPDEYLLQHGDMIVAMTDLIQNAPILGSPAIIPAEGKFLHNQRLGKVVKLKTDRVVPSYLFYLFNTVGVRSHIKGSATGSTVRHTSPSRIYDVPVQLPPILVQRRIASILTAYDELIENSQRRIRILETKARSLYREWFVNFRFPGHEQVRRVSSALGEIPKGWGEKRVDQVCSAVLDGDWIETKDQGGADYRLLQISNIGLGDFVETGNYRFVTEETFRRLNCTEILPDDILVARMPTPIGRAWLASARAWKMITAVDVAIVRSAPGRVLPSFLIQAWNEESNLKRIAAQASGTTRLRITRRELAALEFIIPPVELQTRFDQLVTPIRSLVRTMSKTIDVLRQTRDLLLPRLLAGKIEMEVD